jgi:hypothetical protein
MFQSIHYLYLTSHFIQLVSILTTEIVELSYFIYNSLALSVVCRWSKEG